MTKFDNNMVYTFIHTQMFQSHQIRQKLLQVTSEAIFLYFLIYKKIQEKTILIINHFTNYFVIK